MRAAPQEWLGKGGKYIVAFPLACGTPLRQAGELGPAGLSGPPPEGGAWPRRAEVGGKRGSAGSPSLLSAARGVPGSVCGVTARALWEGLPVHQALSRDELLSHWVLAPVCHSIACPREATGSTDRRSWSEYSECKR